MINIFISDKNKFEKIKNKIKEDGFKNLLVLSDFDKTLTKAFSGKEETPSIISVLRNGKYLTEKYASGAHKLYNKYHILENKLNISEKERKKIMLQWWTDHFNLLIESNLNQKDIEKAIRSNKIKIRKGARKLFSLLKKYNVPIIIASSAGLGKESIYLKLKKENLLSKNIFIISNSFNWNKKGKAISVRKPIIHSANKEEIISKNFLKIRKDIKKRKNIILLGDSMSDSKMAREINYDILLKIGFLNNKIIREKEIKEHPYRKFYDVLILKDSSFSFVNNFLKELN